MKKKEGVHSHTPFFWIIVVFLAIRVLLNLQMGFLPIFFVIVNGIFLLLLFTQTTLFFILFILWMSIDSMIGTYLATNAGEFGVMYFGTMIINLVITALVLVKGKRYFK